MIANVFWIIGVILLILMIFALVGAIGLSWVACLIGAIVSFVIAYFFGRRVV